MREGSQQPKTWTLGGVLAAALSLAGCDEGAGPQGEDPVQADDAAPSGEGGSAELSYRGDVEPIMAAACTCHTTVPAAGGLDLSEGNGYAALVDVEAFGAPLAYVAPGDPQSSYLLHKLDGTQADVGGVGLRMPAGSELTEDQIIVIEDWIEDGAAP